MEQKGYLLPTLGVGVGVGVGLGIASGQTVGVGQNSALDSISAEQIELNYPNRLLMAGRLRSRLRNSLLILGMISLLLSLFFKFLLGMCLFCWNDQRFDEVLALYEKLKGVWCMDKGGCFVLWLGEDHICDWYDICRFWVCVNLNNFF